MKKRIWIFLAAAALSVAACKSRPSGAPGEKKALFYRNPMNAAITSPVPMKDSMGMDYLPVYEGEEKPAESAVPGHAAVQVSQEKSQLIGVQTGEVDYRELKKVIRAAASVAYDQDLYNSISEYRAALQAREKIKDSPWPDVHQQADSLVNAAGLRLRQMGLSEAQIADLQNAYPDPKNLLLGEKGGSVWVYAQVYEYEAGLMHPGQAMEVTSPALPGRKFFGAVQAVDPILNSATRSLRVRALVPNREGLLKPEMYVNAKIDVDLGSRLALPEEAVLNTGERQIVFVVAADGSFVPRDVVLGPEADGYYAVVSGVSKGERVVTSANFLIDSESRLKSALTGGEPH